jgi:hypothetical protein
MPESEPKPRLIELVAPGAGQGWKAVLKNGKAVVVHEIPVPAAEAAAAVPRLQRLAEHRHPALSPVLAWGTDPNGIWVAVEPNEGVPLAGILSRGPFTPPAAAALGAAVLSGVAALHEAGIAMGGFGASAVRITSNGDVRLAGHPAAAVRGAPSQSDLRADVRSCGMAVCAAFGVDPAGAPAPPNIPPGLVVTMRSMASGAMGPAADRAQGALREMASALLAPDRQVAAQSELALRAGGREMPSITPYLPQSQAPVPAAAQAAPPAAPTPAPFVPPPPDETPVRAPASYDPPPRSVQTYPSLPAIPIPPPVPSPPAPAAREPAAATPPAVPTWDEAPPRTPTTYDAPSSPMDTNPPPAPFVPVAPLTPPAAPAPEPAPPAPAPYEPPPPARWEPAAPASPFDSLPSGGARATNPPAPATPAPTPPTPAATSPAAWTPAPSAPTPAAAPETKAPEQTWSPAAAPVWAPGAPDARSPALSTTPPSAPAAGPAPVSAFPSSPVRAPAPRPSTVARRPAYRAPIERPTWLVPAVIAVVVILLLGTVGAIVLHGRGAATGGTPKASPTAKTSPTKSSPTPSPTGVGLLPIPDYGNTAPNPPLTSVKFCTPSAPCVFGGATPPAMDTHCTLGGPCHVDYAATWSGNTVNTLTFTIEFFDRCSNPNNTSTVVFQRTDPNVAQYRPIFDPTPKGGTLVTLPSGAKAAVLVLIADTGTVKAASAPLQLGAESCT